MKTRGGFTLIEIMIALTVFVLLAAAVFEIFTSVLESVDLLQDHQKRQNQVEALQSWLNHQLEKIAPPDLLFSWPSDAEVRGLGWRQDNTLTFLYLDKQSNGLQKLCFRQVAMATGHSFASYLQADYAPDGVALLTDLQTLTWRFLPRNQTEWQDRIQTGSDLSLIEATLQRAGEKQTVRFDFWRPPLSLPPTALPGVPASPP